MVDAQSRDDVPQMTVADADDPFDDERIVFPETRMNDVIDDRPKVVFSGSD